jgi:chorismate-pyruvate lyase
MTTETSGDVAIGGTIFEAAREEERKFEIRNPKFGEGEGERTTDGGRKIRNSKSEIRREQSNHGGTRMDADGLEG